MNQQKIIAAVAEEVKKMLVGEGSGHDWWHIVRVWKMAERIGQEEKADMFVVELAALVHELGDEKINRGEERHERAGRLLLAHAVDTDTRNRVMDIISRMSFRENIGVRQALSLEGRVVQDADRLDAMGAIGIARAFAFGGKMNRPLHDPAAPAKNHTEKAQYTKRDGTTINHFYEKLLLLKDRMNTKTAKRLARGRHAFMKRYLRKFFEEWKEEI